MYHPPAPVHGSQLHSSLSIALSHRKYLTQGDALSLGWPVAKAWQMYKKLKAHLYFRALHRIAGGLEEKYISGSSNSKFEFYPLHFFAVLTSQEYVQ